MKLYQLCILSLLLINQPFTYCQQSLDDQQTIQQKETTPVWKKAAKWFGAIGLAAFSTVILYQGTQFGYGKYIGSHYRENEMYKKYEQEWERLNNAVLVPVPEVQVKKIVRQAKTIADLDIAEKFFIAKEGYLFARSHMVQAEIAHQREFIKDLQRRRASW